MERESESKRLALQPALGAISRFNGRHIVLIAEMWQCKWVVKWRSEMKGWRITSTTVSPPTAETREASHFLLKIIAFSPSLLSSSTQMFSSLDLREVSPNLIMVLHLFLDESNPVHQVFFGCAATPLPQLWWVAAFSSPISNAKSCTLSPISCCKHPRSSPTFFPKSFHMKIVAPRQKARDWKRFKESPVGSRNVK